MVQIRSGTMPMFQELKSLILNFGPQHPAAHGVLRLILQLKGEVISAADPHIGLLHRGTEKLVETKHYLQNLPYFDRLDYVSMLAYEHTYVLAIEKLLNLRLSIYDSFARILLLELTRLLNHLLCIGCQAMDLGAVTPYFLGFEEREKIAEFYERLSGARMHAAFFRPGGLSNTFPNGFLNDVLNFIYSFQIRLLEIQELLDNNRIWKERLVDIGCISSTQALQLGFSGVMLRGSGLNFDLRKDQPYEHYDLLDFNVAVSTSGKGDCYDRYKVRIAEMFESIKIIEQCCLFLISDPQFETFQQIQTNKTLKIEVKTSMESLIDHFKVVSEGLCVPAGETFCFTEAPKGEFGVYLLSNGTSKPLRCKIKAPGFNHLQSLNFISKNHLIADLVTLIGSLDIVFGEIDR